MLLGRDDINPNKPDQNSLTSLMQGDWNKHMEVIKILLEQNDSDPNKADKDGHSVRRRPVRLSLGSDGTDYGS